MMEIINQIIHGHVIDVLSKIPEESVDCVITSPPYWQMRDYKTKPQVWGGNPECRHQFVKQFCVKCGAWLGGLGLEPDLTLYLKNLMLVFDAVKRVLKKQGTLWINLGDKYGCSFGNWAIENSPRNKNRKYYKSLMMIPQRFAINMIDSSWILRNNITWNKNNCMPCGVKDRFNQSDEKFFFFVKQKKYYFCLEKAKEKTSDNTHGRKRINIETKAGTYKGFNCPEVVEMRLKRTVWNIPTRPGDGYHFSHFPEKLIVTPIEVGCPPGGIVLDPFSGTGTTCRVADKLGRKFVGIELNNDYVSKSIKKITPDLFCKGIN
jgi:site-specific DNA-methyltransferase (adenine-specific)